MTDTYPPAEPSDASAFTRPVADSPRARRYMEAFDRAAEQALRQFDGEQGLIRHTVPDSAPGVAPEVANLDRFARKELISPLNLWAYGVGRSSASIIGTLAYAYAQPLSRYCGDEAVRRAVCNGFEAFIRHQADSGEFVFSPIRFSSVYGTHEMAWRLECLITAFFCVRDALPSGQRARYWAFLNRAMRFLQATPCDDPCNRGMVWTAVMAMCWRATGDESFLRDAREMWRLIGRHIFHESGQVNEGPGPDIVYSPVSYEYLMRFRMMTGDRSLDPIIRRSTDWMAEMYTESLVAFRGASTRYDIPDRENKAAQLLMGFALFVGEAPHYADMAEALLAQLSEKFSYVAAHHGSITWLAAAAHDPEAAEPAFGTPRPTWVHHYGIDATDYYTVGQTGYQTMISLRGLPEKKGVQTWAVRKEPPFICPDSAHVSTVRAWGYDLAARDVTKDDDARLDTSAIPTITARHGKLIVTYLIGAETMIVVHTFPRTEERETIWSGDRQFVVDGERVIAEGARGELRWCGPRPTLSEDGQRIHFRDSTKTQVYAFAAGALRNLRLTGADAEVVTVEWTDGSGSYRAYLNHTNAPLTLPPEARLEPNEAQVRRR